MTALIELNGPAAAAAKDIEAQEQFSGVQSKELKNRINFTSVKIIEFSKKNHIIVENHSQV